MKVATKRVAGCSKSSSGVPTCSRPPAFRTATRSPSSKASSCSWVTKSVVIPIARIARFNSRRVFSRSVGSRFESGSSSSSTRGDGASARASATRCCWPPEISVTLRPSKPESPASASTSDTRAAASLRAARRDARPKATFSPTVMWGKSA